MESIVAVSNGVGRRVTAGASTNLSEAGKSSDVGRNDPLSSNMLIVTGDSNTLLAFKTPAKKENVW